MYMFGGEWANAKVTRFVAYDELWLLDPDRTSALRSCDGVE